VQSRGDEVWSSTQSGLSHLDTKTNTWTTYSRDPKTGRGEILIVHPDGSQQRIATETSLAHNYILNTAFQGDDLWVATAQGLSHGIHAQPKE
jgi:frataxin-like iron-binding protein CyaY